MRLGLHYWNYSTPADPSKIAATLADTAQVAEQAGVSSFTVMDHYFQMEQAAAAEEPMLEGYTTLGYVAGKTERMTLGVLVTGVMYRYPGLLAKIVTTLDVLSGGRARLGIGASWYEREQRGLGVPVVPVSERFERLEETLRICLQMWSDDNGLRRLAASGVPTCAISGNHDTTRLRESGTPYAVLADTFPELTFVYRGAWEPIDLLPGLRVHAVPHCAGEGELKEQIALAAGARSPEHLNLLVTHAAITVLSRRYTYGDVNELEID